MTVNEIRNYATVLSGLSTIPEAYTYLFINEVLYDLAMNYDEAGKKEDYYITQIKDEWTNLPDNCTAVKRCFRINNSSPSYGSPTTDFLIENGQIQFGVEADYKIEYIALPDKISKLTDIPDINQLFHDAIAYWVAYKELCRVFMHEDMTEGTTKSLLLTEYGRKAQQANTKLRLMKKSRKHIKYAPMI